MVKLKILKLGD